MKDAVAFPVLDDQQMAAIAAIGDRMHFESGVELISQGQRDYPFYAIESGEIDILEQQEAGEVLIATHGVRAFSGDIDMLTGRSSMFTARARGPVVAWRLCAYRLRRILGECPTVSETLLDAFQKRRELLRQTAFIGVRVIGFASAAETSRLEEFFYKNRVPYTFFDRSSEGGQKILRMLDAEQLPMPVVRCNGHTVSNPSLPKLAGCIGIHRGDIDQQHYDLVVVGSGPAGLAAAVYAASEGIRTLVIDKVGPGGQAGSSSKIENFIGFPSGISGSDLAARGYLQALKFGAQFIAPVGVTAIEDAQGEKLLKLDTGQTVFARCVFIATGVSYRQLDLPGCTHFEGAGVYYAATSVEARACENRTAIVVGGGNSAGQAAMFLAERAQRVKLLLRGDDITKSMSSYLSTRVSKHPKIEILANTEVDAIDGDSCVASASLRNNVHGHRQSLECAGLFLFIGAKPHTEWLPSSVMLDEKGFVLTGSSFFSSEALRHHWTLQRTPCDLETTHPGIMAGGDVRSGTTKRCGFAVGDGSLAIACVHRYLNQLA